MAVSSIIEKAFERKSLVHARDLLPARVFEGSDKSIDPFEEKPAEAGGRAYSHRVSEALLKALSRVRVVL